MTTSVHEIADGIYRISVPITLPGGPGGFTFNQYLIVTRRRCCSIPARAGCSARCAMP